MDEIRITWQAVVLTMIVGQGVLFGCVLIFHSERRNPANFFLVALVALLIWHHLDFLANTTFAFRLFPHFFTPNFVSWFLLGPLMYFYVRFAQVPDYSPGFWVKGSFSLGAIALLNYLPLYLMGTQEKVSLIQNTVISGQQSVGSLVDLIIPGSFIFASQLIILGVFLCLCIAAILVTPTAPDQAKSPDGTMRLWLSSVVAVFTLAIIVSNFFFWAIWVEPVFGISQAMYLYIAPLTLLLLFLEFGVFLNPQVYIPSSGLAQLKPKYSSSDLDPAHAQRIVQQLESYMAEQRPFLDSKLRLSTLSKGIGVPVNHLSQAMNQVQGKSFFELVNHYRIDAAIQLINEDPACTKSLLDVAIESGFNNKTSFLNAFKKAMGMNPSSYRNSLRSQPN